MASISLYPIKYLSALFVPYGSFLETSVLLPSVSYMLNIFFVFVEVTFFDFCCCRNLCSFHSFPYIVKKKVIFFCNNLGICALIISFSLCLLI